MEADWMELSRRDVLALLLAAPVAAPGFANAAEGWLPLFDGHSLTGWKASEKTDSFRVEDGSIVAHGGRSHLFYEGPVEQARFRNFEFSCQVFTQPGANSGVYFHTAFQPEGWPQAGFEVQLANTFPGDNKRTGSLYGVRNVYKQMVHDKEWFTLRIAVRAKQVLVWINDVLVVEYTEPAEPFRADLNFGRVLQSGTFALQAHDPTSETRFRNLRVRPLPDALTTPAQDLPAVDENFREIIRLGTENIPVVDYHVHLKGGLTLDQALANSRRTGIFYGIAINCGLNFPVHDEESVGNYLASMKDKPCYVALQGEGREWTRLVSANVLADFDYCFTDAMTFHDDTGYRRRLYVREEVGDLSDTEAFMELYTRKTVEVLREPIQIFANPTALPDQLAARYDELWTAARMKRVIDAALEHNVAIEINNRRRIPSLRFLQMAKAAGAKFSFGTNNAEADLGKMEYALEMTRALHLTWRDIFVPQKAEVRGAKAQG